MCVNLHTNTHTTIDVTCRVQYSGYVNDVRVPAERFCALLSAKLPILCSSVCTESIVVLFVVSASSYPGRIQISNRDPRVNGTVTTNRKLVGQLDQPKHLVPFSTSRLCVNGKTSVLPC
jgi:hypothetical protein